MSAYSVEHMLAFIHIPKCAGTSIRSVLASEIPDWSDFDDIDKRIRQQRDPALANHFPVYRIESLLEGSDIPFLRMIKFMVVRNPFERLVSLYHHRLKKLDLWYEGEPRNTEADKKVAREGFIPWLLRTPHAGDSVLTRMPQYAWGVDRKGRYVPDFVLKQESLVQDWERFCLNRRLSGANLPQKNLGTGESARYRDFYNNEARGHVERYFAKDLNEFGYEF